MTKLLRVPDIVERLQVSRSKVYELIESGRLPHYRIDGCVRVAEDQLEAYLESVRQQPGPSRQARGPEPRLTLKHLKL